MKRLFILSLILCVATLQSMAQGFPNFWSIKAGVNFANISNSDYSSKCLVGFNGGANFSLSISQQNPLFFQTGLGFEMKGAENSYSIDGTKYESTTKSYAVEIPALLSYGIYISSNSTLYPFFGVFYSFAVAGDIEGGNNDSIDPYKKENVIFSNDDQSVNTRMFQRSDFGIRIGLDYKYMRYSLGIAYDAGLANIYAKEFRDRHYDASTGTFSINLGYYFE